ncbi:MAG: methylglyoxal synthase [Cyanobacteria bacterium P01_H01_bin.121]
MSTTIALIAQASKHDDLVSLAHQYRTMLARYTLIAEQETGQKVQQVTGLPIETLASGVEGGCIQIAARVVTGEVAGVVCLLNPHQVQPYESDAQSLLRICAVHNVPIATNLATAELALQGVAKRRVAHLIFNPVAGQGNPDQDLALIRQLLEPQVHLNTIFTQRDVDPVDQAKAAIATIKAQQEEIDTSLIIASGGDGTVSAIASATIGTGIPLGVIPRGTANAFSVALGIPTNLRLACETIAAGSTRQIDAARCNDTPMILLAGVGFEAGMVDKADRELKNRFGTLAYVLSGAQQLFEQAAFTTTIELDSESIEIETGAITVANAAPPTSIMAQGFGEVIPDDGLLEVTIAAPKNRLQGINTMATLFASALVKTQFKQEGVTCLRTQKLRITTNPPQKLVVDGEIMEANPVEFECIPRGLTIFTPLASI